MKREEKLFDLLGEIDDKYYLEAIGDEPQYASPVTVHGKRFPFLSAAAVLAVIIGAAASLVILNSRGFFEKVTENIPEKTNGEVTEEINTGAAEITLPPDIAENADLLDTVPIEDLNRAVSQALEFTSPSDKQLRDSIEYFLKEHETLSPKDINCYTIDLNFDNTEEIVLVSWENTDIFIFELSGNTAVFNSVIKKESGDFEINEENFTDMGPYYGEDVQNKANIGKAEAYYHFDFRTGTDDDFDITAAAIKYDWDNNRYYTESVLSYGMTNSAGIWTDIRFTVNGERLNRTEENEEKFDSLWCRHEKLSPIILPSDINYCKKYVLKNYNELVSLAQYGYFSQPISEDLYSYTRDLNFDGIDELIVVDWANTPLFVFEQYPGEMCFNSVLGNNKIRSYITEENFKTLAPFEDSESGEKYLYYFHTRDYPMWEKSRTVSAIKYSADSNLYYTEHLLTYGVEKENLNYPFTAFFIEYLNLAYPSAGSRDVSCEEFCELWNKHTALPSVSFVDIRDSIHKDYEKENHDAFFDFDTEGYDFYAAGGNYLIDENNNITAADGGTDGYEEQDVIVRAMACLAENNSYSVEYMGDIEHWYYGDVVNINNGKAYQYTDRELNGYYLLVLWNPDPSNAELFGTAMFKRCHSLTAHREEYPDLDLSAVPDVPISEKYENRNFTEEQHALYEAVYPCYSHAVLYKDEKYGYKFELIAENICKDSAQPDRFYRGGSSYVRITDLSDSNRFTVFGCALPESIPIKDSYEEYTLRVYELKDGLVMFNPDTETSGYLTVFFTITENGDRGIEIGNMYGDYGDLMIDMSHIEEGWKIVDIDARFTADYERNTLYYKDTAYVFDFGKVGIGYDYENNAFVPCFEAVKIGE